MSRRTALCSVLLGIGLHTTVFGDIINVPGDQPTIQAAIDAAVDGDEVVVADGTYTGDGNRDLDFGGKLITVRSANGPDNCIIDSQGCESDLHRGFYFHSGETDDAVVDGFTIRNGFMPNGGGVLCESSSPTIVNCTFSGNTANAQANDNGNGGGIHCTTGSSPRIDHCVFIDNEAVSAPLGSGGGGGGLFCSDSNPTVTSCVFNNNQARVGGGIRMVAVAFPEVSDCTFSGNTAISSGGGMQNTAGSAPIVTNCTFIGNMSHDNGGGMSNFDSIPTVANCAFIGNTSHRNGGGMHNIQGAAPIVIKCTFIGNAAFNNGGGFYGNSASPTLTNCTFSGNFASNNGGGMANSSGGFPTVTNCTFSENSAPVGGGAGMFNWNSTLTVSNCTFSGNTAYAGGGMFNRDNISLTVSNCTFSANEAYAGAGMLNYDKNSSLTVINCILWGNTPHEIVGETSTVMYSDVKGGFAGEGNIDADPRFVDPSNGDYHLLHGSPCIDAADNTGVPADTQDLDADGDTDEPIPVDLDGNPRFVDDPDTPDTGNPDGINPIVDMGAYEFGPPDLCADDDGDGLVTICHIPPGNPDNAHTITVGVNAVPAHLAHGDHCGPCEEDDGLLLGDSSDEDQDECSTDLDDSGGVGAADLAELLGAWGANPGHPADVDGDGNVGPLDLAILLGSWGSCP